METKENKAAVQLPLSDTVMFRSRLLLMVKRYAQSKKVAQLQTKNLIVLKLFQQNFPVRNF